MRRFEIKDHFYLDGESFKILSGGIHYFRTVPEYWEDRLIKLRAMGLNTVETYVPWNMHEPREGEFNFTGICDIKGFSDIAARLGLYVIVRPSPYICAEWEFGGMPSWLIQKPHMELRSSRGGFLDYVKRYYEVLLPMLIPYQIDNGGPVILMQVENEYGSYGQDKIYLERLRDMMRMLGVTVPLITSDGPRNDMLHFGSVEGALPTANFGSGANERFDILEKFIGNKPLMCTEFWVGWFDSWGCGKHNTTDVAAMADTYRELLKRGSANIYMFHGGTNFGLMNGSNDYNRLSPDVTSYDYDALLTEDGQITPKYKAFKAVIDELGLSDAQTGELPPPIKRRGYGKATLTGIAPLLAAETMGQPVTSDKTITMEGLSQAYGYTLYRTTMQLDTDLNAVRLFNAADRAHILHNGKPILILYDLELTLEHSVDFLVKAGDTIEVLVENMGRVNYGAKINAQEKGIAGGIWLNGRTHEGWQHFSLPMTRGMVTKLEFNHNEASEAPAFFRYTFDVKEKNDTFLDTTGWGKGCVFINGFCLGRFWEIGPQKRLYIPAPLLRDGENEIIIFETDGKRGEVELKDLPDLG